MFSVSLFDFSSRLRSSESSLLEKGILIEKKKIEAAQENVSVVARVVFVVDLI